MRFFFSGELHVSIAEAYRPVRKEVETILNTALADRNYGDALEEIGIIAIILPDTSGSHLKERRLLKRSDKTADYRLCIDFEAFSIGPPTARRILLVENLISSIQDIDRKLRGLFDGRRLRDDILELFPEAANYRLKRVWLTHSRQ